MHFEFYRTSDGHLIIKVCFEIALFKVNIWKN